MDVEKLNMPEYEHLNNMFLFRDKFEECFDKLFLFEDSKTIIKEDNREVKLIKNQKKRDSVYILEKVNKDKNLYHSENYFKGSEKYWKEKIYEQNIFSIKESKLDIEHVKTLKAHIALFKKRNIDIAFIEYHFNKEAFNVTQSIPNMYEYLYFMKNLNLIKKADYLTLNNVLEIKKKDTYKYFEEYFDDWKIRTKEIKDTCLNNGYLTNKKSFNYGNHNIWADKDYLYMSGEHVTLCISDLDKKDFSILMFDNYDYSSFKKLKEKINEVDLNLNGVLSLENGEITSCNLSDIEYLSLDISFISKTMVDKINLKFPIDIYSYNYQKNFYKYEYDFNEADFLVNMFLCSSEYSKEDGLLYNKNVVYYDNLIDEIEPDDNLILKDFIYCNLSKINEITYLNDDWVEGLKKLSNVLKNTDLLPKSYLSMIENENKNIDYIISVVDNKIEELENYKLNNSII